MQLSLSRVGQLTPVQVYRVGSTLEVFDGIKRLRAARALSWSTLRADLHPLDSAGAKVRLLCCNAGAPLAELEEAWLVRSLYRDDGLNQPQIAVLLSRHKSWVSRRLSLAEGLSDELSANVRLGLVATRAAVEMARLPRGNQDAVMQVVTQRGLTTRQTERLVQTLLSTATERWSDVLEKISLREPSPSTPRVKRRTPGEQLVADAWAMKRISTRMHARLLERSLTSLGEAACSVVANELIELRSTLAALTTTIDARLSAQGETDGTTP